MHLQADGTFISTKRGLWLFSIALAIFLVLAWQVITRGVMTELDLDLQLAMGPLRNPVAVTSAYIFTQIGNAYTIEILTLACAVYLMWRGAWYRVAALLITLYATGSLLYAIKDLVNRQRPIPLEGFFDSSPSFPSGHCTDSAAFAVAFILLVLPLLANHRWRRPVTVVLLIIPLLVAVCRIVLSMHYLTDVMAGLALGSAMALLVCLVVPRFARLHAL